MWGFDLTFKKSWINFIWSFTVNVRFAKFVRNLQTIVRRSGRVVTIAGTHDLRYLATCSAGFDFICSRKNWKSNGGGWSLSTSLAALFGVLGADPGVCERFSSDLEWELWSEDDGAGPWDCDLLWLEPCPCVVTPKVAVVGLAIIVAWSIESGRDVRTGDLGMNVRAIAASPDRDGVVDRDIGCGGSWVVESGSGRGLSVTEGTGTGAGTGIGAGGGRDWMLVGRVVGSSWVTGSDWVGGDFGGTTGG